MPLYGDILQAIFFYLKNSINRQINGDLEPLKGFGINFLLGHITLYYIYTYSWKLLNKGETTRNPQKTLFKFLAGVSKIIAPFAVATAFRVLYWWRQQCKQISNGRLDIFKKIITLLTVTVLVLFTFFNLMLDAPRIYYYTVQWQCTNIPVTKLLSWRYQYLSLKLKY
jgi:hypothetical protein